MCLVGAGLRGAVGPRPWGRPWRAGKIRLHAIIRQHGRRSTNAGRMGCRAQLGANWWPAPKTMPRPDRFRPGMILADAAVQTSLKPDGTRATDDGQELTAPDDYRGACAAAGRPRSTSRL